MPIDYPEWNGNYFAKAFGKLVQIHGIQESPKVWVSHPPFYNDIGKKSRDLFNKGFYFGVLTLDVKTREHNSVELFTSWTENIEERKLYGMVEAKYRVAEYNLTLTEKLNKNRFLNAELSYKSKLLNGLTYSFGGSFSPSCGLNTGLLKTEWFTRYCAITSELEIGKNFSFFTSSAVFGSQGAFAGIQWKYNMRDDRLANLHIVCGYESNEFRLHTFLNAKKDCESAIYHRISPNFEIGVDVKWWSKNPEPVYGIAFRYLMHESVAIRGKITSINELGFSYEHKLKDGLMLTMSTLIDMNSLIIGKRNFGLGLSVEM